MTPNMIVAFVRASTEPFNVVFNRVAAAVTGGEFCHCEIAFDGVYLQGLRELLSCYRRESRSEHNRRARAALKSVCDLFPKNSPADTRLCVAFYALQGMPLGVRVLAELAEDPFYQKYGAGWRQYIIKDAPGDVVTSQFVWCLEQTGKPYDTMAALTSAFKSAHETSGMEADRERWFCSNHALRFCQHMALCGDLGLSGTTPNNLDRALYATYIETSESPVDEERSSEGSSENVQDTYYLNLDQSHWQVIADFVPHVIRSGKFSWDRTAFLENDQEQASNDF